MRKYYNYEASVRIRNRNVFLLELFLQNFLKTFLLKVFFVRTLFFYATNHDTPIWFPEHSHTFLKEELMVCNILWLNITHSYSYPNEPEDLRENAGYIVFSTYNMYPLLIGLECHPLVLNSSFPFSSLYLVLKGLDLLIYLLKCVLLHYLLYKMKTQQPFTTLSLWEKVYTAVFFCTFWY